MLAFFFWGMDPVWMLITFAGLGLSLAAAARVKSTFARFAKVGVRSGMSGAEAARAVLRAGGVSGVRIEPHQGFLTDHYDPRQKVLRLSPQVYEGRSVSAVAVAAHEAGHALQDARGYLPLHLRSAIVPMTQFGSRMWIFLFMFGIFFNSTGLIWAGILAFGAVVLFQLVTLPTEFDASRRAKLVLAETGITATAEERAGVAKVLDAAAMTYVAAAATAVVQLLYLIMRARR